MLTNIIATKNMSTSRDSRINMNMLRASEGHFWHSKFDRVSYLFPSTMSHLVHKYPVYPVAQFVGNSASMLFPPLHASGFGHSTMVVELELSLQ